LAASCAALAAWYLASMSGVGPGVVAAAEGGGCGGGGCGGGGCGGGGGKGRCVEFILGGSLVVGGSLGRGFTGAMQSATPESRWEGSPLDFTTPGPSMNCGALGDPTMIGRRVTGGGGNGGGIGGEGGGTPLSRRCGAMEEAAGANAGIEDPELVALNGVLQGVTAGSDPGSWYGSA
jgi:hypothetical protein